MLAGKLQKPSGETTRRKANFVGQPTTGQLKAILLSVDLDELGLHKVQVYVKTGTSTYNTEVGYIEVAPNIDVQF